MLAWDREKEAFVTKGENFERKYDDTKLPCLVVFDLPYLNGVNLCSRPLAERLRLLREAVREVPGALLLAARTEASGVDDLLAAANAVIERGDEGLILKHPASPYLPDARRRDCWVKWKPDFMEQLQDDFDAVVIGGYYGQGRRGGALASFALAVAEPPRPPGGRPTHFRCIAKVGGGFPADVLACTPPDRPPAPTRACCVPDPCLLWP